MRHAGRSHALGVLTILFAASMGSFACNRTGQSEGPPVATAETYPVDLLERSWPILTAENDVRQPYEAGQGWVELVAKRDLRSCVTDLGPTGGTAAARAHAEAATMYRQASLLYANAMIAAWGSMAEPTDPLGGAHLLTVSYALAGDLEKAREQSARLDGTTDPSLAWHGPWASWLADPEPQWPPDLSGLPLQLPEPKAGAWPPPVPLPHYTLKEQSEEQREIAAADLGALVAVALWHDGVARGAVEDDSLVDLYAVQYRWPIEGAVDGKVELPLDLYFGSDYLVPEDASFLAAVGGDKGAGAVDEFKDRSLLAALCDRARVEGKIDPEKAIDLAAATRGAILARMKEKADGNTEGFHRTFADIGRVAALRGLALVAEAEGDHEVSGRLRILAWESSDQEWTADPSALLALGAWDAANEYPVRASEMVHNLIRRYPSLETARFGVDVLSLRVSRRRGGGPPGQ